MGALGLGIFVYVFADNMLLPLVNTNNIRKEDVICIQIFSSIADVARLVEEVLSSLDISKFKTSGADDEKQWRFSSRNYPQYYYLYARSEGNNSVDLAFLNFTEGPNELYRSEKHEKDLNFLKEIITAKLKINNIISKSKQNTTLSNDIFEIARNKYKRKRIGEVLESVGSRITEFYRKYPWIFLIIASLLYPIVTYILKIIRSM